MPTLGLLGALPSAKVADRAVLFPRMLEAGDLSIRRQLGEQGRHVDRIGGEQSHLDHQRLPLEHAVVVGLGAQAESE